MKNVIREEYKMFLTIAQHFQHRNMMSQLNTINNAVIHNIVPLEIYETAAWNKLLGSYNIIMEDKPLGCWPWSRWTWTRDTKVKIVLPEGWKWKYKNPLLVLETEKGDIVFSKYYDLQILR